MRDIMVDLETMGTAPNAAIVAIGAVEFDINTYTLGEQFYCTIDLESSVNAGGVMEASTVLWWLQQGDDARNDITSNGISLPLALAKFKDWMALRGDIYDVRIWGNGAPFDNVILASAYTATGIKRPWKYWNDRCYRTLEALRPDIKLVRVGVHHNAAYDAKSQALHLLRIFKSLKAQEQGQEQKQKLTMEYMLQMQENEMAETEPDLSPR